MSLIIYAKPLNLEENQEINELYAHLVKLAGAIKFTRKLSALKEIFIYGLLIKLLIGSLIIFEILKGSDIMTTYL
ncbi:MAG: hypothetical protein K9W44_17950 [Candidatus Lokiarchaeota archaeon]|nr:hypothetical protein [Candidatus Harpocratesius repetitus]